MPKGYWIPHLDISNMQGFQAYRDMADAGHKRFGSKLLARGGRREVPEGKMRARNVLREFNSYDEALTYYRGPDYSRAHPLREPYSECDFLIVEGYKPYQAANAIAFGKYGGRFLVRGGRSELTEGRARSRAVVLEFPSYEAALACYRSPEYQRSIALRKGKAEANIVAIEAFDPAQ